MCIVRHAPTKERLLRSHHDEALSSESVECGYDKTIVRVKTESNETRVWAVGRFSMLFLLVVTCTDVALQIVNTQINQIESHDYYDALSPDVIRPAFLYKSSMEIEKPSLGLGSAAISSITDALGPILPFTGGVDLRRSEYYTGSILENLSALAKQTYEAYENARMSNEPTTTTTRAVNAKSKVRSANKDKKKHTSVLGASEPFVSLDSIAQLTLGDIGTVIDYVVRSTQDGFNPSKFINGALPRVSKVIKAMENAAAKSRGKGIEVKRVSARYAQSGSQDAFLFCAALRVFAEWRILRQVPEGYKGYAVGMSLGQKDVVQNVAKMEKAAQAWIDEQSEFEPKVMSPSLRDVLQYEIDSEVHPSLPRLKETSGAMGLLWVRRQLHYQTVIFENILEVPKKYASSREAVSAAYTEVYGQYHGWAVQKIFNYSFQASPRPEEIFKFMNPHKLVEVKEAARLMETTSSTDSEPIAVQAEEQAPENIFHRIGWEWDKLVNGVGENLGKLIGKDKKSRKNSKPSGDGLSGDRLEEFVCAEMSKDAHEHIVSYLEVGNPLLDDIAQLFDELNMDDPTKV